MPGNEMSMLPKFDALANLFRLIAVEQKADDAFANAAAALNKANTVINNPGYLGHLNLGNPLDLSAGDQIPNTSTVLMVQGNGGPVTMTSKPVISDFDLIMGDFQLLFLIGVNDNKKVTIRTDNYPGDSGSQIWLPVLERVLGDRDVLVLLGNGSGDWKELVFATSNPVYDQLYMKDQNGVPRVAYMYDNGDGTYSVQGAVIQ